MPHLIKKLPFLLFSFLIIFSAFPLHAQVCMDPDSLADACDFDNDGLLNVADIDDDNDGVLDTMEQDCFLTGNLTDGLLPGSYHMDTWLLTHGIRIRHIETVNFTANTTTFGVINHPSWVAQGDTDNKLIWRSGGGGVSIAFFEADSVTKSTTNTFSIWSDPAPIPPPSGLVRVIARDSNGVELINRFDPDGSQHVVDISQTGGIAIHEVVLAFNSSAFDLVNLSGSCLDRDTDGDSFPDRFDLDADGDGCSDAHEAGATTDSSANFEFTDLAGDLDGLSPSVDAAGDGTPDYTSTYAVNALDNSTFTCPVVLPVQLSYFRLDVQGPDSIKLDWGTHAGLNLSHFEIERSNNATIWERIESYPVKSTQQSERHFTFYDIQPIIESLYYRLKIVKLDGSFSYSETKIAEGRIWAKNLIRVFPNPVSDLLHIEYTKPDYLPKQLKVLDAFGKQVKHVMLDDDGKLKKIIDMRSLSGGIYFIQLNGTILPVVKL